MRGDRNRQSGALFFIARLLLGTGAVHAADPGGFISQEAALFPPVGANAAEFGGAVALGGNTVFVGTHTDGSPIFGGGTVFVFDVSNTNPYSWSLSKQIVSPDGPQLDEFGYALAICGDILAISAPRSPNPEVTGGAVYLFARDLGGSGNWGFLTKLTSPTGSVGDWFGISLAMDQDLLVVGARSENAPQSASGAAYIFGRNVGGANHWGLVKRLVPQDGSANDNFGISVAIDGGRVVIGAYDDDTGGLLDSGSAYVFERDRGGANNWGQAVKLVAPDAGFRDRFGNAVAIGGDAIVVGASLDDELGTDSDTGSAYLFKQDAGGIGQWGFVQKLLPPDLAPADRFGFSIAMTLEAVVISSINQQNRGTAYIYGRHVKGAETWALLRQLVSPGWQYSQQFGHSVAIGADRLVAGVPRDPDSVGESARVFNGLETALRLARDCDGDGRYDVPAAIAGMAKDCNGNLQPDACDIAEGGSVDGDENGVPDECEQVLPCAGDANGDGVVSFADITATLSHFGMMCP